MRKNLLWSLVPILFIVIFFHGCSTTKSEIDIFKDLQANSAFSLPHGMEIKEFSIIKRLTDQNQKTDKVYVQIDVENSELSQSRAYVMDYTHYNEGWMLDSVVEYMDEDYWSVQAKVGPTKEILMESLIDWSNKSITANYSQFSLHTSIDAPLYFEAGKYDVSFSEEHLVGDSYQCLVSVVRHFTYVSSYEDILVSFTLNPHSYVWELVSAEPMALSADWLVAEEWSYNEEIELSFYDLHLSDESMTLSCPKAYGYMCESTILTLTIPTFEQICPTISIIDCGGLRGSIYGEITLLPDGMWIEDRDSEVVKFDGSIEVCYPRNATREKYIAFANECIEAIYENNDFERYLNLLHPSLRLEHQSIPDITWGESWNSESTLEEFTFKDFLLYDDYGGNGFWGEYAEEITSYFREMDYNVDTVSMLGIELLIDGENDFVLMTIIKDGENFYLYV